MDLSTRWSVIVRAQGAGPQARAALGELIRRYQKSVMALIRHRGYPPDQTPEDLTQEFFARALKRNDFARLDQDRGHFRGWLHTAVTRFLANDWDRWHRTRARDADQQQPYFRHAEADSPELLYLRAFSWDTLMHALDTLRDECGNRGRFDALKRFLPGPQVDLVELTPVAESLGMTRVALAVAIYRLRERFKDVLRAAVAETLDLDASHPDAEQEIYRETALVYRLLRESSED